MNDLEDGWTAHKAPTGHTYYYNAATKKSTYRKPSKISNLITEPAQQLQAEQSKVPPTSVSTSVGEPEVQAASPAAEIKTEPSGRTYFTAGPEPVKRTQKYEDRPKKKQLIPGAEPWLQVLTTLGHTFYHNPTTAESVWSAPEEIQQSLHEWNKYKHENLARQEIVNSQISRNDYENEVAYSDASDEEPSYDDNQEIEEADENMVSMEFNEDDIARQLEAMQEAGEGTLETDFGALPDFTQEEKEKIFTQMLSDNNVDVYRPWDSQVEQLSIDPRYLILDTTHDRKSVFQDYCVRRIKQHQNEKALEIREDPKVTFLRFLKQHARSGQYFVDFKRKHRKDEAYKIYGNSDHDREKLFRSFQDYNKMSTSQKEIEFLALLRLTMTEIEHDTFLAITTLLAGANAFPHMAKLMDVVDDDLKKRAFDMAASGEVEELLKRQSLPTTYQGQTGTYAFKQPSSSDYRGPCPGLNTAANHGYLPHNGIATYAQLISAQMALYNVGPGLANLLALIAVPLDGDIITTRMSIGGEATSLTAPLGGIANNALGGKEGGLDTHDTFEADSSLTRNDYYLANGDNHSFNGTLFGHMVKTCQSTSSASAPLFDRTCMSLYRSQRYDESLATNGNFYFGPKSLLLYGASSFLYELMPTAGGQPDLNTISSFFGASPPSGSDLTQPWTFNNKETIPPAWFPRTTPYELMAVGEEIIAQYLAYPKLFGGNVGANNFDALNLSGYFSNGKLSASTAQDAGCLLYGLLTDNLPSSLTSAITYNAASRTFVNSKLGNGRSAFGCPNVVPGK
ncbi:protein of unknown function [Taphrina deformans PYCC 5710]|uniref:WW domain-containing protein n=1 Tax=Taphrina deformans (strain PYCC 5710 / ATCC 11124 / CBS 356.35 / IMI 108563 / JCM 9778 / NBRC 8474) TaxID=1097556 RepID=R4XEH7_TAPDE|nr:protein of unknown function [Taphrina deformans PYCC 5710]|eukprot:CCG84247.1 protein of unknown function [Taphrina deformans PYCC 5710]